METREPGAEIDELARSVIGAAIEVHRVLGPGFVEAVYEEAMCLELAAREIPFARQVSIGIDYKGHLIGEGRLDLWIAEQLIVELKSVDALNEIHMAQVLSYLRITHSSLALLINFNVPLLKQGIKRVVLS